MFSKAEFRNANPTSINATMEIASANTGGAMVKMIAEIIVMKEVVVRDFLNLFFILPYILLSKVTFSFHMPPLPCGLTNPGL